MMIMMLKEEKRKSDLLVDEEEDTIANVLFVFNYLYVLHLFGVLSFLQHVLTAMRAIVPYNKFERTSTSTYFVCIFEALYSQPKSHHVLHWLSTQQRQQNPITNPTT
jgi:hypothetical protein